MSNECQTVDSKVKAALLLLGVPVERIFYAGDADTYITFRLLLSRDAEFSDDESTAKEYFYRADIFSKTDYVSLIKRAECVLKEAEFYGITVNAEIYEKDTGYYHVPIEFYYMEE